MSKWFRTGGVAVALLMAIFLQMDTLTRVLGGVLAVMLWLAVASCLPEEISDYSKAQKVIIGVILGSIVMITALLVKTIMSKGLMDSIIANGTPPGLISLGGFNGCGFCDADSIEKPLPDDDPLPGEMIGFRWRLFSQQEQQYQNPDPTHKHQHHDADLASCGQIRSESHG